MRSHRSILAIRAAGLSIVLLVGSTFTVPTPAVASGSGQLLSRAAPCQCPAKSAPDSGASRSPSSRVETLPYLGARDEAAALEAIQLALTEVGDGSTYVWHRHGGRLSGLVQPTQSFVDALGRVCRHIVLTLNDASRSRRAEGIACRLDDGGWQLDG